MKNKNEDKNHKVNNRLWKLMGLSAGIAFLALCYYAYFFVIPKLAERSYIISHLEIDKIESLIIGPYKHNEPLNLCDTSFNLRLSPEDTDRIAAILKQIKPVKISQFEPTLMCTLSIKLHNVDDSIKYHVVITESDGTLIFNRYYLFGYGYNFKVYQSDELGLVLSKLLC